jgi:NCAIR mutase (PurE)-related protein
MDATWLRALLEEHKKGAVSTDEALAALKHFPVEALGFANIDTHRALRCGFPEVVLARGKSEGHLVSIVERMLAHGHNILITRTNPAQVAALQAAFPEAGAEVHPLCGAVVYRKKEVPNVGRGTILVVSAGTADLPVAEEAVLTASLMGHTVQLLADVGVAGLHRLLRHRDKLVDSAVIVVVAGMDAALPSVVGGLTDRPVIAVPTSTGYGAAFEGLTPLLAMLNSCAAGVTVVNIDNGFGAGYAAALANRLHPGETRIEGRDA